MVDNSSAGENERNGEHQIWGNIMKGKQRHSSAFKYIFQNHRILSREEEREVFRKYKEATTDIEKRKWRDYIINHNLKFVAEAGLLLKSKFFSVEAQDLIGYGMFGLFNAINTFDLTRGTRFFSWAAWNIKQQINKNVQDGEGCLRVPAHKHVEFHKAVRNGDMSEELANALSTINGGISLNAPKDSDSNLSLINIIKDENTESNMGDAFKNLKMKEAVNHMNIYLDKRSFSVIKLLYGIGGKPIQSTKEISMDLGVTPEAVRSIRNRSFKALKKSIHLQEMMKMINTPSEQRVY